MTERLRIGAKFGGDMPVKETLNLAKLAERTGYSSLWVNETRHTRDAVTRISAIAAVTDKATLGTAVLNPYTRSLMLLAITASTIDEISGGRFILGMGVGTKKYLKSQGIMPSNQLTYLKNSILLMRRLWNGETLSFEGEGLQLTDAKLDFKPTRNLIPIYVGATEDRGIRFAANVADGIILNGYTNKSHVRRVKDLLEGERANHVPVLGNIMVSMDEDEESAIEGARKLAYTYFTSIPTIAKANGIPNVLIEELKQLENKEGMNGAMAHLPDEMITNAVATGTPEQIRQWILDYSQCGLHEVLITRIHGNTEQIIREVSELNMD
jgi:5,10-methylenetetrahydromethanopterin reductase